MAARLPATDLTNPDTVAYFTWDAPMTVREIHEVLRTAPEQDRLTLLGKILREARDTEVWHFTTPEFVIANFEKLRPHLGRRRSFWEWLLRRWREEGMIGA